jgi:hypothetical protein
MANEYGHRARQALVRTETIRTEDPKSRVRVWHIRGSGRMRTNLLESTACMFVESETCKLVRAISQYHLEAMQGNKSSR